MEITMRTGKVLSVSCLLAMLAGFSCWAFAKEHPTDAQLKTEFVQRRQDYEKLIQISNEDKHLVRIAMTFTWLDTDASWPRDNVGLSPERWNAYRSLFRKLGISDGL